MKLEVLTPKRVLVQDTTKYITIPSELGELGILEGHSALVTKLNSGVLSYQVEGKMQKIAVHFGYAEIRDNHIFILADLAEKPDEIDEATAKKEQAEAEEELKNIEDTGSEALSAAKKIKKKLSIARTRQEIFRTNPTPM